MHMYEHVHVHTPGLADVVVLYRTPVHVPTVLSLQNFELYKEKSLKGQIHTQIPQKPL